MTDPAVISLYYQAGWAEYQAAEEKRRPSYLYRPAIFIDGNKWCALYGANIQDGVCGFGDSPADAMRAFDCAWYEKLSERPEARGKL